MLQSSQLLSIPSALVLSLFLSSAHAENFSASMPDILLEQTEKSDEFLNLVYLWGEVLGNDIKVEYYPFKRSVLNVVNRQVDFHFPLIKNPYKSSSELGFDYSTSMITNIDFVLYTRRNKPIDIENLSAYKIATDAAHSDLFNFPVQGIFTVDGALQKLNSGRIDGYIFSGEVVDTRLRALNLTNLHRQLYRVYDVHAILPLGGQGNKTDQMITEAQKAIATSIDYQEVISKIYVPYSDWQMNAPNKP